ncbi:MAG: hypothetical protein ACRCTY_01330 [Candidatus Adiutrix sp.]
MEILEPILIKVSDEERIAIVDEAMSALEHGGTEEDYDRILRKLPLSPCLAQELKRAIGIEGMIAEGINLSKAVEAYGEHWLRD